MKQLDSSEVELHFLRTIGIGSGRTRNCGLCPLLAHRQESCSKEQSLSQQVPEPVKMNTGTLEKHPTTVSELTAKSPLCRTF